MLLKGNLERFEHLGIPVSDIEVSRGFYTKLGFEIASNQQIEENGGTTLISFLTLGHFCIELYQASGGKEGRSFAGPVDHIAFKVKDVEKAYRAIKEAGFEILEDIPVFLPIHSKGVKYFNILGPDKEKIEFVQII